MEAFNFLLPGAETVYIDRRYVFGDAPDAVFEASYIIEESLIPMIFDALPCSFRRLHRRERYWIGKQRLIIAQSSAFRVSLVDWAGDYIALSVEVCDDIGITPHIRHQLDRAAHNIFDVLAVRGCALYEPIGVQHRLRYQPRQAAA